MKMITDQLVETTPFVERQSHDGASASFVGPRSDFRMVALIILWCVMAGQARSEEPRAVEFLRRARSETSGRVLSPPQWTQLDLTVDNGLKYLATQQEADGSFPTLPHAKPGVTGLCILAFLSRGHLPNEGPYGRHLQLAVEYILSVQRQDGLFTNQPVEATLTSHGVSHVAMYNHGICGLMLSELYGTTGSFQNESVRKAIVKGLAFSQARQSQTSVLGKVTGGFDYLIPSRSHPGLDLPITSCHLLFFRSAKNAGFDVPADCALDAMRYVKSCYDAKGHTFSYRDQQTFSRGLTGCGILALSLAGEYETEMARDAGDWLLEQSFEQFNRSRSGHDRYFYSAYYCSQAMFQLGGRYWNRYYPPVLATLAKHQRADGGWDREFGDTDRYGNAYSSSLAILALTPPYQLLPIFQR
ncbi:prenyltransferase/squalene oxidase repeat-containing protein [Schlesneria paludicola]|uniref:prenyltransferase/squalene oxidase repeat-containing protein n=1 Tax=Schlesneria paludicola TaxID=360056 RepID=UPI0012F73EB8|nr:prenyltransferase/squalene oxidase repeat-containing protein [Schlesneria paludicola]